MKRIILHGIAVAVLTALTQLGGLAWLMSLFWRSRIAAFAVLYVALSVATWWVAPALGRTPLPCTGDGPLRMQSWLYCTLNRHYAVAELAAVLQDLSEEMADAHPGTVTLVLDAGFPFLNGFPLLPHLSHDDGEKADIAFWYRDEAGYAPGQTRSPIGYFAFEEGPTECPDTWPTLRWDLDWLQPLWPDLALDEQRMRAALRWLAGDPRVGRIFVEPHLVRRLGITSGKIGFQGCRAARHDDHIHIQL